MAKYANSSNQILFPFSPQTKNIFDALLKNGDEIRLVGGLVRDFLSDNNIDNADFDLACKYTPEETTRILNQNNIKTIQSGAKYGTITAIIDDQQFQITTLRKDVENFGRDCEVEFHVDFFEDAKRRDFTINAISIDFAGNVYDYFGGINDLENKIVCFIGDADSRISEDYLRILRFFRFSCSHAKKIDESGLKACIKHKNHIQDLSRERVREELFKLFKCKNRENLSSTLQKMFEAGILELIFNSIDQKKLNEIKRLFKLEKLLKREFETTLFLAMLIGDKSYHLTLSKNEKKHIEKITKSKFIANFKISKKDLLKLMLKFNHKELSDIYLLALALDNDFENFVDDFLVINKMITSSIIPDFPINGNDLINLGINPRDIGRILKIAKYHWWEKNFLINKQGLISFISKKLN
ncbi:MAG: poly(A) polymerase [Rickettsiales bacterium]|jgi:poly(A) polymerase